MEEIIAVVGANYGDEGKGRLVNFLANDESTVIRYSGSAQAGHTVVEEGRRHVFHHFGSATLRGVPTHLTESFLSHPIMFAREYAELRDCDPDVSVDWRSPIVLPTDMIINQALERIRSANKHGSCGMGVRQALERNCFPALRVTVGDLKSGIIPKLASICRRHLEMWCVMNGRAQNEVLMMAQVANLDRVLERFVSDVNFFVEKTEILRDVGEIEQYIYLGKRTVFEGSQGLALDPGCGQLPHLTPSNVGLGGIFSFASHSLTDLREIEMVYATRPYLTRHGAGPLAREGDVGGLIVNDQTNIPNEWQDSLRLAPLSFRKMLGRILDDLKWRDLWPDRDRPILRFSLGVTCVDHVENTDFPFYDLGGERRQGLSAFLNECGKLMDVLAQYGKAGRLITCYGENRDDTDVGGHLAEVA